MSEKAEFCLNSRRWIEVMACFGSPLNSCPNQREQFTHCESCGYYQLREPTKHLLLVRKALRRIEG